MKRTPITPELLRFPAEFHAFLSENPVFDSSCSPEARVYFIDCDGGIGDRHIDIFWGVWTLFFNLKTNRYYDLFLDVYGRELVEPEMLRTVAAFETFG